MSEGPAEDSFGLRALVFAAVMVAVVALVAQQAADGPTAVASLALLPAGYVFSYRRRHARNTGIKVVLAVALVAVLTSFLQRVRLTGSVDEGRAALASLFLWVQVLHSFDLPRRRDLAFSMAASLIVMAEAGSLSLDTSFAIFLFPYAGLGAAWLSLSHRSEASERAPDGRVRRARTTARPATRRAAAKTGAVVVLAAAAVFVALPRLPGARAAPLPFSVPRGLAVPGFTGAVVNPALLARGGAGRGSAPVAYPGFGDRVDLRARGRLSDRVVLKVRAAAPAFWRAQAYDVFDGTTWTASAPETRRIAGSPPLTLPRPALSGRAPRRELVQTFFVEVEQPNVVFAAHEPAELYFPTRVEVDAYGSIRSPIRIEEGAIYSVVSRVPVTTPALLRSSPPSWPAGALAQYTRLSEDVPARVVRLARAITDGEPTTYDKVLAVQDWLRAHTRYNLDVPPDPPGVDAVDYFLFERREGFCEQIASAMAVLLRAVGIPARFAVGFDAGERNLFTGYFEVREADAHSWVEVLYPGVGWVEYDPTHELPEAAPGLGARFIAPEVFREIGRFLAAAVPGPIKAAARRVGALATGAGRAAGGAWPATTAAVVVAGAALLVRRARRGPERAGGPPGAGAAFLSLCETFAARGRPRAPHETPAEYLAGLLRAVPLAPPAREDLERIVRTFERARFSATEPEPAEVASSLAAAGRLREGARARSRASARVPS